MYTKDGCNSSLINLRLVAKKNCYCRSFMKSPLEILNVDLLKKLQKYVICAKLLVLCHGFFQEGSKIYIKSRM